MDAVEGTIINLVQWLRLAVETTGALVIAVGVAMAIYRFARTFALQQPESYGEVRLTLARYLVLVMEFELGADLLSTAIAPRGDEIGKFGCHRCAPHRTHLLSHARNERGARENCMPRASIDAPRE